MPSHLLFVTRVHEADLKQDRGAAKLLQDLDQASRSLAVEDGVGKRWSRANGYPGYTSYGSLADLPTRMSVFGDLKRRLDKQVAAFSSDLFLDLDGGRLVLDNMWVNILKPGGFHAGHLHPHSVISGTAYIDTPDGASALKLEDPRHSRMMAAPNRLADAPQTDRSFVYLQPKSGTVYLWESWLRHEVPMNKARSERLSISFNYRWK